MKKTIRDEVSNYKTAKKISDIDKLKKRLDNLSKNKATQICIFCAGIYGKAVYQKLRNRMIEIEYIADNDPEKWGELRKNDSWALVAESGLKCVGTETLFKDKDNILIIVANKTPDSLAMTLKQQGFPYVITSRQLEHMLEGIDELGISKDIKSAAKLDYASPEISSLIQLFNQEIRNICHYYETRLAYSDGDSKISNENKKSNLPLVSVIMPLYNAEKYVKIAINSILNQTYENIELLLIDDCSTDNTMNIVMDIKDSRIKLHHNAYNRGIAFSRNQGLILSQGKYIAIMDDDDVSMPERIELQVAFLEDHANIGAIGGKHEIINSKGELIMPAYEALYNPRYVRAMYLFRNVYANSTMMIRKAVIKNNDLSFLDNCLGMEDFRFWIECSKVCQMSAIPEIVLQYRQCEDNESSRILNNGLKDKRKNLYKSFQIYSLLKDGFALSEEELSILTKVMEEFDGKCESVKELEGFYQALYKMNCQAREGNFDNFREIRILCKKLFLEKLSMLNLEKLWE